MTQSPCLSEQPPVAVLPSEGFNRRSHACRRRRHHRHEGVRRHRPVHGGGRSRHARAYRPRPCGLLALAALVCVLAGCASRGTPPPEIALDGLNSAVATPVVLPEPLTPVTTVNSPVRMSKSTFCRLCWRAPRMRIRPWVMVYCA